MARELIPTQEAAGASWTEIAGNRVVAAYNENTEAAIRAATEGVALMDRSHWGRIRVTGGDRHKFLHNMTTSNFNDLQAGAGLETVFVTSTARIIDYVTAYAEPDAILLVTSPERRATIPNWLRRFIFFNDDVQLEDVTEARSMLSLYGPQSTALLSRFVADLASLPHNWWTTVTIQNIPTMVASGAGLGLAGYNLIVAAEDVRTVWKRLVEEGRSLGLELMGETAWEQLRLAQGFPRADQELTEEHNPLEAGLWHAVDFRKGCYIGQEVIARLDTYQKVKQRLMAVRLTAAVDPGTEVEVDGEVVGTLTSVGHLGDTVYGLAYVRSKAAAPGQTVQIGESQGELLEAPSLSWGREDLTA